MSISSQRKGHTTPDPCRASPWITYRPRKPVLPNTVACTPLTCRQALLCYIVLLCKCDSCRLLSRELLSSQYVHGVSHQFLTEDRPPGPALWPLLRRARWCSCE